MLTKYRQSIFWLFLITFVCLRAFFFEKISTKALYDFDEARYAEIAKNVILSQQIFIPLAGGPDDPQSLNFKISDQLSLHPYFWKPPLHTLVIALNFRLFGINEFSVRLSSLFFALLSLALVFLISQKLFPKNSKTPYLSVLFLASSNDFSLLSSQGLAETQLLFFSLLSLCFLLQKHSYKNLFLSALFLSLAFLTKSFATFWLFPLSLYLFFKNKGSLKKIIFYYLSFLALTLPWHVFMYLKFGQDFLTGYVFNNTISRASGQQQNIAPVYWYLKYALWQWKYILIPLILIPFSLSKIKKPQLKNLLFLLLWSLLIFIPYSLFKSKVWWYIFPFWIPFLIIISFFVETRLKHFSTKLTLCLLIPLILLINFHSLKQTQTRIDYNLGIKKIAQTTSERISNLSVFFIPYETPLFYLNSQSIDNQINDKTQFVITNIDYLNKLNPQQWQIVNQQEKTYLLKKI